MSTSYTIHLRPLDDDRTFDDLIKDVASVAGSEATADTVGDGWVVQTSAGTAYVYAMAVPFDDEPGLPLSRYPWYVEMTKPRVDQARTEQVLTVLWSLYNRLAGGGHYGCCFVHELSELLATNDVT